MLKDHGLRIASYPFLAVLKRHCRCQHKFVYLSIYFILRVDGDPFMMKAEDNNVLIVVALMSNEVNKNIYETYIHYLSDL